MFTNYLNTGISDSTTARDRIGIQYLNHINLYGTLFWGYALLGFLLDGFSLSNYASIINFLSGFIPLVSFLLLKGGKFKWAAFTYIIGMSITIGLFSYLFGPETLAAYFLLLGIGVSITIFHQRQYYLPIIAWLFVEFVFLEWFHAHHPVLFTLSHVQKFTVANSIVLFILFTLTFHHFVKIFRVYTKELRDKHTSVSSLLNEKLLFEQIINHSTDAYMVIDGQYIVYVNKELCQLFGLKKDEILQEKYEQAFSPFITELIEKQKRQEEHESSEVKHETMLLNSNKEALHVSIEVSALKREGKVLHIITFENITESKQKENIIKKQNKELQEVMKTKEKFFSVISHDLRSPFTGILGLLETLTENYHDMDKAYLESILHKLLHSADNYYSFLDTLLIWTNLQNGTAKPYIKTLDLNELVEEVVDLFADRAQTKNIHIVTDIAENCTFQMDANFFSIILRNFLSNALKFTPDNGSVTISAYQANRKLILSVEDTGVGMDETTIESLLNTNDSFSTFGTAKEKGTGIGLALCKDIIRKNNGKLQIDSTLNEGTTFTVEFCEMQE